MYKRQSENRAELEFATRDRLVECLIQAAVQSRNKREYSNVELAVSTLQQLALDEKNDKQAKLRKNVRLRALLRDVCKDTDAGADCRQVARFLEAKVSGELDKTFPLSASSSSSSSPNVMISYAWKNGDQAEKLHHFLNEKKCVVWRDKTAVNGELVESIIKGILSADCVVFLLSRAYHESGNCKSELLFAKKNGKKIIPIVLHDPTFVWTPTWIAFLMDDLVYYSMAQLDQLYEREIRRRLTSGT